MFISVELVKELMERTKTQKGLSVTVDIIETHYATEKKAPADFKENMSLLFDDLLLKWNYRAIPQMQPDK